MSQVRINSKDSWRYASWLAFGVLLLGICVRFAYLGADPYYYEWIGYITDEGRWVQHARSFALYDAIIDHSLDIHLFLAPVFEFANYVVFQLAGVGLWSSRIFTALCGSGILVLFWSYLRRTITPQALLLGLTLLGFDADLVMLSRVAVPEMVTMCFQLLIYFMIVSSTKSSWRMALAGLFLLLAVGMKANVALLLPIFSVVIVSMPREEFSGTGCPGNWRDVVLFWAGFSLPIIVTVAGLGLFFLSPDQIFTYLNSLKNTFTFLKQFLEPSNAYVYNIVSFPLLNTLAPTFNLWGLGMWLSLLACMAAGWNKIEFESRRYLATSAIWFLLYLLLMLSLEYFPTRYKVHILIPMALFIVVGMSLLQRIGLRKIVESFSHAEGFAALLWAGAISLPTAVFFSPFLASALTLLGVDPEAIAIKLACLMFVLAGVAYLAYRSKGTDRAVVFFLIFPLIDGMTWLVFSTVGGDSFWPVMGHRFQFGFWSLAAATGSALTAGVGGFSSLAEIRGGGAYVTACATFYLVVSVVKIAPAYIDPHYSIRDASRDLANLVSGSSAIATIRAETLFNGNKLPYKSFWDRIGPSDRPDVLVLASNFGHRFKSTPMSDILAREYHLVKVYNLYVAPEYLLANSASTGVRGLTLVSVYEKNGIVKQQPLRVAGAK